MWKNYLITAWRSMVRNRMFSLVNITGLALAVAACLIIGLFIKYEWSYDKQSPHAENIWRAYNETISDGKVVTQDANTHPILGPSLKNDVPEVVDYTRLFNHGKKEVNVVYENVPYKIKNAWMADQGFLRMFPQKFISGDSSSCLRSPFSIVITQSTANLLFGQQNPMGQILRVPGGYLRGDYKVTGVVADPPENTHLKFNILASYATRYAHGHKDGWDSYWDYTYIQLAPTADIAKVKRQIDAYSEKFLKTEGIRLNVQPLTDIHLNSRLTYEIEPNSDARTIRALAFVALFILLIAFINYVNLTTAQSLLRSKEVGVRKVLGANRWQLIRQFLFEGGLISALAIVIAVIVVWAIIPYFEQFLGIQIINYEGFDKKFWFTVPAIWLLAVACACLYPAIALSSYSPLVTLRGKLGLTGKHGLRKVLVVFQFACSITLIIGIFVIVQQLNYLRKHDKGLSLDQIMAVKMPELDWRTDSLNKHKVAVFRQQVTELSGVNSIASSSIVPGQGISTIAGSSGGMFWTENPSAIVPGTIYFYYAEPSFYSTYSIKFKAGEPYEAPDFREAGKHIIINESALQMFGFQDAESAIGEDIAYSTNPGFKMKIHGVVNDFNIESSKEPVRPTLYFCSPQLMDGYLSIKMNTGDISTLIKNVELNWKDVFPENHFEYLFVDEVFNRQFKAEEQLAMIVSGFTLFAVFIACLGLFGLAFITAGQRTKEIGIRKVLGASVVNLVALLSKDFIKLVLIAALIAVPAAAWVMNNWLQNFAYRIQIEWWVFALAALVAIGVAMVTVSFQSIKAARTNPVKNLRTE